MNVLLSFNINSKLKSALNVFIQNALFSLSRAADLLLYVAVTLLEAIYATCGVNELRLTCVEWVRGRRYFYLYYWVLFAFKLYCVVCLTCRTGEEHIAV